MVDLTEPLEGLIYERKNHIAYITLNRPDRGNALHSSQVEPIRAIWAEVRDDPWIRCAIVGTYLPAYDSPATKKSFDRCCGNSWKNCRKN